MLKLRFSEVELAPRYMTAASAGADLRSRESLVIQPSKLAKVPTGVWIDEVDWKQVPAGLLPELQIRARSSLAFKHHIMLANGVGTVDADYPDEIAVLLFNFGEQTFEIKRGDRIAQLVVAMVARVEGLGVGADRVGGFGSTAGLY